MSGRLILASGSSARRALLAQAGVTFEVRPADVDEEVLRQTHADLDPAALSIALARAKAEAVSAADPHAWVLGADQIMAMDDEIITKAGSVEEARARLLSMRGRPHALHSGLAIAYGGETVWTRVDTATLQVRDFSDDFLEAYLAAEADALTTCVGGYRLEGLGAQLFERVEGDYFTVLGLPLWGLLAELRRLGVLVG